MSTLISLDPGQSTGWAAFEYHGRGRVELLEFGVVPVLGTGIDWLVRSMLRWADERLPAADEVAFEGPLTAFGVRTRFELHEVRAAFRAWCILHDKPYWSYHPSTVKATSSGHGSASKAAVGHAMKQQFGVACFKADHESDAVAVGVTHFTKEHGEQFGNTRRTSGANDDVADTKRPRARTDVAARKPARSGASSAEETTQAKKPQRRPGKASGDSGSELPAGAG